MSDLLKDGVVWLAGQLKAAASQTVQYVRGANSVQVAAVIGRSVFDVNDTAGGLLRLEARDYLIIPADLGLFSTQQNDGLEARQIVGPVIPREGDTIIETDDAGNSIVYEVSRFGAEPCWRFDPYRVRMIVHTRKVSQ